MYTLPSDTTNYPVTIDARGAVYLVTQGVLYALLEGQELWRITVYNDIGSPVIGSSGLLYIGGTFPSLCYHTKDPHHMLVEQVEVRYMPSAI